MEEIWKDVKGFEGRFKISNQGRVLSINGRYNGEQILNIHVDKLGYHFTTLRMAPLKRQVRVHQLVAEHFLIQPEGLHYPCTNHKDGNKLNNHVDNLEWVSRKDNCTHAVDTGLHDAKGSKHHNSKLTESEVKEMRTLYNEYPISHRAIGVLYGVTREQARDVINRKNWKHI
jgi:hypothetical protein